MKLTVTVFMRQKIIFSFCFFSGAVMAQAQTSVAASVPYTPSWTARHHLQWLADHAGLPLTGSHWPLPAAAVEQALSGLAVGDAQSDVQVARDFVRKELAALQSQGQIQLHLRSESEALNGFAENYTPGSSAQLSSPEVRRALGQVSVAGRLGARVGASPNSLQTQFSGMGTEGKTSCGSMAARLCWA